MTHISLLTCMLNLKYTVCTEWDCKNKEWDSWNKFLVACTRQSRHYKSLRWSVSSSVGLSHVCFFGVCERVLHHHSCPITWNWCHVYSNPLALPHNCPCQLPNRTQPMLPCIRPCYYWICDDGDNQNLFCLNICSNCFILCSNCLILCSNCLILCSNCLVLHGTPEPSVG